VYIVNQRDCKKR